MGKTYFEKAVEEWIEYCNNPAALASSNSYAIKECQAYRKILLMDYEALPLIRKLYEKDDSNNFALSYIKGLGLIQLVHQIIGKDFQIPENIREKIDKMVDYTKNWLDENMGKYPC